MNKEPFLSPRGSEGQDAAFGGSTASPGEAEPGPRGVHSGQSHVVFPLVSPCQTLLTQPLRVSPRSLWVLGWDCRRWRLLPEAALLSLASPGTWRQGGWAGQGSGWPVQGGSLPLPHQQPSAWPAWGCSVFAPSSSLDQVEAHTCVDGLTCCPCPDQTGTNRLLPLAKA